jgi:hypothetical protein
MELTHIGGQSTGMPRSANIIFGVNFGLMYPCRRPRLSDDLCTGTYSPTNSVAQVETPTELLTDRKTNVPFSRRTQRHNDPMDPHYDCHGVTIQDDPKYSRPRKAKEFIPDNHLLQTADIAGASSLAHLEKMSKRKDFNVTNYNVDIEGAQHDTIRHSIRSTRRTHPLQPVYESLDGGGEVLTPCTGPLIQPSFINTPTLRMSKSTSALNNASSSGGNNCSSISLKNSNTPSRINSGGQNVVNSVGDSNLSPKPSTASLSLFSPSMSVSYAAKFDGAKQNQTGPYGELCFAFELPPISYFWLIRYRRYVWLASGLFVHYVFSGQRSIHVYRPRKHL